MEFSFFLLFYIITCVAILLERSYFKYLIDSTNCTNSTEAMTYLLPECACALLFPTDPNRYVSNKSF